MNRILANFCPNHLPQPQKNCRIVPDLPTDELNKILDELEAGENAVKRLSEMDELEPTDIAKQFRGAVPSAPEGVLADNAIANNLRQQAAKMEAEAKALLAEAKRLKQEATQLSQPKAKNVGKTKKATA